MIRILHDLKATLSSLLFIGLLVSCGNISTSLPHATNEQMALYQAAGDSTFHNVWSRSCEEMHNLMVLKDGKIVYEKWANCHPKDELHILWSATKTFTALAVGLAADDSLLNVDDKVVDFFSSNELPLNSESISNEWLRSMTIKDLLIMSSGFGQDHLGACVGGYPFDWAQKILNTEVVFKPGSRFSYNSMNSYLLSVIVSKVTGKKLSDYLDERIFKPLGIEEYFYEESPQGYSSGGWGLYMSVESFAKIGQLFLQKGVWKGKRIISEEWINQSTSVQIYPGIDNVSDESEIQRIRKSDDWKAGYGYQMWICANGCVRLDGAWGQFCIIDYQKNAVIATQCYTRHTHLVLKDIWENIYKAL